MNNWDNVMLTTKQKDLLREFLLSILPPSANKRRSSNNELSTITKALDRWFMRHYEFHIGLSALAELFEDLEHEGYTMLPMGQDYDPDAKKARPAKLNGDRGEAPYLKRNCDYIYVNVKATRVSCIRKFTYDQPANTNADRLRDMEPIQGELRAFLIKHLVE